MSEVKPLKLVDQGGGVGALAEFGAADKVPAENLPATEWAAETVPQAEADAGTGTTRRAWTAQRVRQAIVAWWNGVTSAWGRSFVASADASAGRTALGLGNAATRTALGTTGALYSRDSILGTVSQSGGVPTGAIIERGSNANGEYVRFADGTQICTKEVSYGSLNNTTEIGALFWSGVIQSAQTYAASFAATPVVTYTGRNGNGTAIAVPVGAGSTTTSSSIVCLSLDSGARVYNVGVTATGRWF